MKTNRRTCLKIVTLMLLAVLVSACLNNPFGRTAAGGTAIVTLSHDDILDGTEFTLNIYKVGTWIHDEDGKAVLKLDSDLATAAKVEAILPYSYEDDATKEALLDSSRTVGDYIKGHSDDFTPLDTQTVISGGDPAVFSGLEENGLYIVTGDTTIVKKKRWTPISAYIDILNNEKTLALNTKMESTPIVDDYSVTKAWNAEDKYKDKEKLARPKSIDVEITFGDHLVDTVTLSDANNWTYSWKVDESEEDAVKYKAADQENWDAEKTFDSTGITDRKWHVFEVADKSNIRYKVESTTENTNTLSDTGVTTGTYMISNKYDVTELEIIKNLDGYVDAGEASNITVAFKVKGFIGDTVVYENTAGLVFGPKDDLTKSKTITNIPSSIEKFEVEEVYAAGYEAEESKITKVEKDAESGIWKFEFDNTHGPGQGSGVVNKFKDGKYTDKEDEPVVIDEPK